MMVGRDVNFVVEKKQQKPGDVVLSVRNFSVKSRVHKNDAVKNVSLDVRAGEIVCLAGIEGNGQTEFISALTGLEKARSGHVTLCGKDISRASIRQRSIAGMSHVPEDRHKHGLVLDYTLAENMVREAVAVANATGCHFDVEAELKNAFDVAIATGTNRSSMLQDVTRQRETEIKIINGAVVKTGKEAGIPTPYNEVICQLIQAKQSFYLKK